MSYKCDKKYRGYLTSREFNGMRLPQHIQNQLIVNYCAKKNFEYMLSEVEHTMLNCYMILQGMIKSIGKISGIVCCSIYQLPQDQTTRLKIYKNIVENKKSIHFVIENLSINTREDIGICEDILQLNKFVTQLEVS